MTRLAAGLLLAGLGCRARAPETAAPAGHPDSTPAPRSASPGPARPEALVGRWLRSDSDYTIEIAAVAPDGKLDASYFNPGPIHVARAESRSEGGALRVFVELQDRGYPGSNYELTYDPGSDSLSGVYHHLGEHQDYEVVFSRVSAPAR